MCHTLLHDPKLYTLLTEADEERAARVRAAGCFCGGVLHSARYPRKPRGIPPELRQVCYRRHSFCCNLEGCRRRHTPQSVFYLGRRVYLVREHGLACRAPALRKGDLFFWNAKTIHGSLETRGPRSRSSFTGHFVPSSTGLLQFQTRARRMKIRDVDGVPVHHPKDQNLPWNRALLGLETTFPKAFQRAKKMAIKAVTR